MLGTKNYLTNRRKNFLKTEKNLNKSLHKLQEILSQEQLGTQIEVLPYGTLGSSKK